MAETSAKSLILLGSRLGGAEFATGNHDPSMADRDPAAADYDPSMADRDPAAADYDPSMADRDPAAADRLTPAA